MSQVLHDVDLTHGQSLEIAKMLDGGLEIVDATQLPHGMVAVVTRHVDRGFDEIEIDSVFVLGASGVEYRVF